MAGSIKGIIVEIGGDTSGLQKALSKVNSATSSLSKELRGINSLLKLDPKNTELVTQKQQVLSETIKDTENKLKLLHSTYDRAVEAEANGSKISEENWRNIQREIINTENKLKALKLEASNWTKAGKSIEEYGEKITKVSTRVENLGNKLTTRLSLPIAGLATAGIKYNADIEKYTKSFETFLGSAEKAANVVEKIKKDAGSTPFDITSLIQANQMLISTNEDADSARETILALGDAITATGGGNDELTRMAANLQQVKNAGVATALDIKQFAYAGIDIYGLLADYTGKSVQEVKDMKVSYEVLTEALKKANKQGGKYFNAMSDASEILTGQVNKLKAEVKDAAGNLTKSLMPTAKKVVNRAEELINKFNQLSDSEKENIIKIGLMVAAMGPLVKILGKTGTTLGNGVKAVGTFSRAIGVMKTGANSGVASVDKLATILGTISNPVGLATVGITTLTAAMTAHIIKTQNEITSLGGLKKELDAQQDSWNNLKNARNENLTSSLTEISNIEKLSEELKKMTDANGQVKEGYEARANYIINELNNALGTEYKMNGNIIEQYSELKDGIDSIITKKKAEAYLNAYQEEYQTALKNSNEAMDSYVKLWEKYEEATKKYYSSSGVARVQASQEMATIQKELKEQSDMVNEYGQVIENYENLVSASASGSAETIEDAMKRMGQSYSEATGETKTSLTEQIQQYESYKEQIKNITSEALRNNKQYLMDMIADNANSNQQRLDDTIKSLREQTSAINGLTEDQKNAWKELARSDRQAYTETISKLDEDTRNTIEKATGIWVQDTGIEDAAKGLGEKAETGFRTHIDGKKWGMDLSSNIASGMTSQKSEMSVSNASSTVAGWIKKILGHSVPKAGPLKDELTYMPDMIENFSNGIDHNKAKLVKSIMNMTKEMQEKLKLVQLQNFGNLQGNLSNQVIDNTKTVFTTPQIVFNVQELDEAKLNQCFNYINRKFGSKY